METGKAFVCDNEEELEQRLPRSCKKGVRAVGVFPLQELKNDHMQGALHVCFYHFKKITEPVLRIIEVFAKQIEIVIQNHLFLKLASETAEQAWNASAFQNFLQSLASLDSPGSLLERIANSILIYLPDADNLVLYEYSQSQQSIVAPPVTHGEFLHPNKISRRIYPGGTLASILREGESRFIDDVYQEEALVRENPESGDARFVVREGIKSSAHLLLKAHSGQIVGILLVNYRTYHPFFAAEKKVIRSFASAAAIAMENARLLQEERTRNEVSAAPTLNSVSAKILSDLRRHIDFTTASLQLIRNDTRALLAGIGFDVSQSNPYLIRPVSKDPIVKEIVTSLQPVVIANTSSFPHWERQEETSRVHSWIGLPLVFVDKALAILTIDHDQPGHYTLSADEVERLMQYGRDAAVQLHQALVYDDADNRIANLRLMNDVTDAVGSKISTDDFAKDIVARVVERLRCDQCTIFLRERGNGNASLKAHATSGRFSAFLAERSYDITQGVEATSPVQTAFLRGKIQSNDSPGIDLMRADQKEQRARPRSFIAAPIAAGDHRLGVLFAEKNEGGLFAESHKLMLDNVAHYAGIAIERDLGLDILQATAIKMLQETNVTGVLDDIVDRLVSFAAVDSAVVQLVDRKGTVTKSIASHCTTNTSQRKVYLDALTREALKGEVFLADTAENPFVDMPLKQYFRSILGIPLALNGQAMGALFLFSRTLRTFSDTERLLLRFLGEQAALVIQKTQAQERTQEKLGEAERRRNASHKLAGINNLTGALLHAIEPLAGSIRQGINTLTEKQRSVAEFAGVTREHVGLIPDDERWRETLTNAAEACKEVAGGVRDLERGLNQLRETADRVCSILERVPSLDTEETLQRIKLSHLLDRALQRVRSTMGQEIMARIDVTESYQSCSEEIETYARQLIDTLADVITNAVEAMKHGGRLIVTAETTVIEEEPYIELRIEDTGAGIDPKYLPDAIYNPRHSTKGKEIGLGLYYAKHVFEANGIRHRAESTLGKGTTFILHVPVAERIPGAS